MTIAISTLRKVIHTMKNYKLQAYPMRLSEHTATDFLSFGIFQIERICIKISNYV